MKSSFVCRQRMIDSIPLQLRRHHSGGWLPGHMRSREQARLSSQTERHGTGLAYHSCQSVIHIERFLPAESRRRLRHATLHPPPLSVWCTIPFHTMPCHATPYHTVPCCLNRHHATPRQIPAAPPPPQAPPRHSVQYRSKQSRVEQSRAQACHLPLPLPLPLHPPLHLHLHSPQPTAAAASKPPPAPPRHPPTGAPPVNPTQPSRPHQNVAAASPLGRGSTARHLATVVRGFHRLPTARKCHSRERNAIRFRLDASTGRENVQYSMKGGGERCAGHWRPTFRLAGRYRTWEPSPSHPPIHATEAGRPVLLQYLSR